LVGRPAAKLSNNAILKGLHDPGDRRSRNELFKQIGRVVVTQSEVENLMSVAFICVSRAGSAKLFYSYRGLKLFYSYRGFEQRFKLVGYAIAQNDWGVGRRDRRCVAAGRLPVAGRSGHRRPLRRLNWPDYAR